MDRQVVYSLVVHSVTRISCATRKKTSKKAGSNEWLVKGLMFKKEVTGWCGLQKNGKSWLLLSLMKALLTGEPFFGESPVVQSSRVVYFMPGVGRTSIYSRLKKMGLDQYLDKTLFVRTAALGVPDLTESEGP